jgi:hypothetical protein
MGRWSQLLKSNVAISNDSFTVEDAKYLYHDGTSWKFGNVSMLKPEKFENLLFCTTCGQVSSQRNVFIRHCQRGKIS